MRPTEFFPASSPAPRTARRRFDAAAASNLTASWIRSPTALDSDLLADLRVLVARARDLGVNDPYFRRFLGLMKNNVIGARGIQLKAEVSSAATRTPAPDPDAAAAVAAAFTDWGRLGQCDVTGRLSWRSAQHLFVNNLTTDGEVLLGRFKGWRGNKYRYAIQFLDPLLLDVEHNERLRNGNEIVMGVELNQLRRPVAYYLLEDRRDPRFADIHTGRRRRRIDASAIFHAFLPERAFQTRGFPAAASALKRMQMLDGYEEATLVSARLGAATTGFFKRSETGEGFTGTSSAETDEPLIDAAEPGGFFNLPVGVEPEIWDPKQPTAEFGDFVKSLLRGVAAGLGVGYNALANDLEGVNFSALRSGANEEREVYKGLQEFACEAFASPIFEDWQESARLASAIRVNGGALRDSAIVTARWQPRRWPAVQPLEDMKANEIALRERLTTRGKIIREAGEDPEQVWSDTAAENEKLESLGIPPVIKTPAPTPGKVNANEVDEDENDAKED